MPSIAIGFLFIGGGGGADTTTIVFDTGSDSKPKLSKTERRPEIIFGGVLCSNCRSLVFENAIKVKLGVKKEDDLNLTMKKFVSQAIKRVGLN